jgi:hypothetical protein
MSRATAINILKLIAVILLTWIIDKIVRWTFLNEFGNPLSEEILAVIRHIHVPLVLAVLTAMFYPNRPITVWLVCLFAWLSAVILALYYCTCLFIIRFIIHRPDLVSRGEAGFAVFLVSAVIFWLVVMVVPRRCPGCRSRTLLIKPASGKTPRWFCVLCGQTFYRSARSAGVPGWICGEPASDNPAGVPAPEKPELVPENEMFPGLDGILFRAAKRARPTIDPDTGYVVYRYDRLMWVLPLIWFAVIPVVLLTLMVNHPSPSTGVHPLAALGFILAIGAVGLPFFWYAVRFALSVSPAGLLCRSPWKAARFLFWDDVELVSYTEKRFWQTARFTIRARDRWKFRVSILVPGLSEFLAQCERHLSREKLAKARLGYLRLDRPFPESNASSPANTISSVS